MAELEPRVEKLEIKVTTLEQQVSNVITKLDMFIAESRAARERQDADIREMRQGMKDLQKDFYQKVDGMGSKMDGMGKHVRNMSIVTIIGIAAMVVAVFLK